jgi:hypothetical protein
VLAGVLVVLGSVPAASAAATIEVNSTADSHAVSPARGTYADKKGRGTLRAALEVAKPLVDQSGRTSSDQATIMPSALTRRCVAVDDRGHAVSSGVAQCRG